MLLYKYANKSLDIVSTKKTKETSLRRTFEYIIIGVLLSFFFQLNYVFSSSAAKRDQDVLDVKNIIAYYYPNIIEHESFCFNDAEWRKKNWLEILRWYDCPLEHSLKGNSSLLSSFLKDCNFKAYIMITKVGFEKSINSGEKSFNSIAKKCNESPFKLYCNERSSGYVEVILDDNLEEIKYKIDGLTEFEKNVFFGKATANSSKYDNKFNVFQVVSMPGNNSCIDCHCLSELKNEALNNEVMRKKLESCAFIINDANSDINSFAVIFEKEY